MKYILWEWLYTNLVHHYSSPSWSPWELGTLSDGLLNDEYSMVCWTRNTLWFVEWGILYGLLERGILYGLFNEEYSMVCWMMNILGFVGEAVCDTCYIEVILLYIWVTQGLTWLISWVHIMCMSSCAVCCICQMYEDQ